MSPLPRSVLLTILVSVLATLGTQASGPPDFVPDGTFTGSALTGWRSVGAADWRAENGEIIGRPKSGAGGGWLVMDKSFEDLQWFANIRCEGACRAGVLLRATPTPGGGLKGVYVSLTDGDFASYRVT